MTLSKNVLYYGRDVPLPEQTPLRAGPLSMVYEAGDLRYIKLGDREILRRVYVAVRDRNWGTVLPTIFNVRMQVEPASFQISYDVENKAGDIDFFWQGRITGDAQGTIIFTMEGEARSTFWRNRIGFCTLHPIRECAGRPCFIERVDGPARQGAFPLYIAPEQPVEPFAELSAITYEVTPGVKAEIRFSGDVFEMEDQRNWTDASYKIFCTPLGLPFPVEVKQGTKISQSITLTLKKEEGDWLQPENEPATAATPSTAVTLQPASAKGLLPRLGLGAASHGQPLSQKELDRLRVLRLSHLRVDLRLFQPDYDQTLHRAWQEAQVLDLPLEVALFVSDEAEAELGNLLTLLEAVKPVVWAWMIFHQEEKSTGEKWVKLARDYLTRYDAQVHIGGGTNADFYQLNQFRPPHPLLNFISFSINPQVHAFDNISLAETLEAQAAPPESARHYFDNLPVHISPVTLKPRFNAVATGPEPPPPPGELPAQVDVRQMSLFGAGWTVGSLKYLAESQVESVTYYETSGWRGVMETEAGSPLPEKFQSLAGSVFPLYHVLADVAEFNKGELLLVTSGNTLLVEGLALRQGDQTRLILANLTELPQPVTIQTLPARVQVRHLNETNVEQAMQAPEAFRAESGEQVETTAGQLELTLLPYAVVRIDG